jgi:hypothetical protein
MQMTAFEDEVRIDSSSGIYEVICILHMFFFPEPVCPFFELFPI